MKKVSILVIENCTPLAPVGAMEVLNKANQEYRHHTRSRQSFFDVELVGVRSKKVNASERFHLDCHTMIEDLVKTDLLLIPGLDGDIDEILANNVSLIPHILRLHKKGAEVGSMCTGAFILASTGLLNGKKATTHWAAADKFRQMFPAVELLDERIVIDEKGVYTCGGATSFLNLCIYLTEKFCGKEIAVLTSKMLLAGYDKINQSEYSIFFPQHHHGDEAILKAQQIVESATDEKVSVEALAKQVNMSKRNFIRRFKASTGNTPVEYVQRISVEKAKRVLELSNEAVEHIIYSLGYNDVNSFRKLFVKYTNMTPKEYRLKYRRY